MKINQSQLEQYLSKAAWILKVALNNTKLINMFGTTETGRVVG